MHPRLSVSQVSSRQWSLDEDLAFFAEAGIDAVGVSYGKLTATDDPLAAARAVRDAGHRVTNLLAENPFRLDQPDAWSAQREQAGALMDTALELGPELLVLTTGAAGSLTWERAADALEETIAPLVAEATREGLAVLIEHTNPLRVDIGFVHTLRDAIELAWRLDVGVCMDVAACWAERNLQGTLTAGIDAIGLVQVSDYLIGTHHTPDGVVPGEGDIPLRRILGQLLDAGYPGVFDIEIVGPRIDDEGYPTAIRRSLDWLTDLLDELLAEPDDE